MIKQGKQIGTFSHCLSLFYDCFSTFAVSRLIWVYFGRILGLFCGWFGPILMSTARTGSRTLPRATQTWLMGRVSKLTEKPGRGMQLRGYLRMRLVHLPSTGIFWWGTISWSQGHGLITNRLWLCWTGWQGVSRLINRFHIVISDWKPIFDCKHDDFLLTFDDFSV